MRSTTARPLTTSTTRVYGAGDYRIQRDAAYNLVEEYRFPTRAARQASVRPGDRLATWDAVDRVWVQL